MAVVTVDFDGTLFKGDSFRVMFQAAKKEYTWREWGVVATGLLKAAGKGVTGGKEAFKNGFFKAFTRSFKGKSKQELDSFFQELIRVGKDQINIQLVECMKQHQKNGDTVIVLSGAFRPFLEAFLHEVKLDAHIISTELHFDDSGISTGGIVQFVNGNVKVEKVKEWLHRYSHPNGTEDVSKTWAYADSVSDAYLLEFVDYPVVVNPKKDMQEVAKQRSWPIFPETK